MMEGKERRRFFCREWVFRKLLAALEQPRSANKTPGTIIVGQAGAGKTTLCKELASPSARAPRTARLLHERHLAAAFLLRSALEPSGHHCYTCETESVQRRRECGASNGHHALVSTNAKSVDNPLPFLLLRATAIAKPSPAQPYKVHVVGNLVLSVVVQLLDSDKLPGYRDSLLDGGRYCIDVAAVRSDPESAFKSLVLFPLRQLPPPKHSLFLLVDNVDGDGYHETTNDEEAPPSAAELLSRCRPLLPPWLVLVVTARRAPSSRAISKLFSGFRKLSLDDLRKSAVAKDVSQYIVARLAEDPTLKARLLPEGAAGAGEAAAVLNQLHIKSDGNLLYLERVLDLLAEGVLEPSEIQSIPGTLNGLWLWLCQAKAFRTKRHQTRFRHVAELILASPRKRLGAMEIVDALGERRVAQLARRGAGLLEINAEGFVTLGSRALSEWALDVKHCTQRFLIVPTLGHRRLAMTLSRRADTLDDVDVAQFAEHLVQADLGCSPDILAMWLIEVGADVSCCLQDTQHDIVLSEQALRVLQLAGSRPPVSPVSCSPVSPSKSTPAIAPIPQPPETRSFHEILSARFGQMALSAAAGPGGGRSILHLLAAEGNAELLQQALLAKIGDVEAQDRHGQTALNVAARHGHTQAVQALLEAGAAPDQTDRDGWTALRAAAWGGHVAVVEALLQRGAAVDRADSEQRTALRAAAWGGHLGAVAALLEHGADVNYADKEGRTALIAASYMGHGEIVQRLLDAGADIDHEDRDGRTALSVAALCAGGLASVVALLLERGAAVNHQDREGMTPLLVAAFEGHRDVVEVLLEWEADPELADRAGRTPLWASCSSGHRNVAELLLFWGACVDHIDAEGRTVLSAASAQGDASVVSLLLDRGLDEQHRDNSGWSPLHYAAFEGHGAACAALLAAGASVDACDNEGKSPLMLACQEGHVSVAELLMQSGAPIDQRAHDGNTALRLASMEGHEGAVKGLLARGADPDSTDADGRSTLYVLALENRLDMARYLLERGADAETRDAEGRTPLHVSAWQGHVEMVSLLLRVGGADPNSIDGAQRTALHSAAWQGHAAVVRLLLRNGALPDHTCSQGATALGIAAQEGHEACARALLEHGGDPTRVDRCGRDAARVAARAGHTHVVRLIESFRPQPTAPPSGGSSSGAGSVTSGRLILGDLSPDDCSTDRTNTRSTQSSSHNGGGGAPVVVGAITPEATAPPLPLAPPPPPALQPALGPADSHFARDTHMRIILGSGGSASRRAPRRWP